MFCSTIIPTIGRTSLTTAVNSVLNQVFDHSQHEIIVVNDSGQPLFEASWQHSDIVRVIHTNRQNRSIARNSGAAIARGQYLHFLDDDDWILPDAFRYFWELAHSSNAAWLYGAFRLVDNAGERITDIHPAEKGNCSIQLMAWEWLPLQASLISSKAFSEVGGFAPLDTLLGGFEDVDISRQVSLLYDTAYTDRLVAVIRIGEIGSTTDYIGMFRQNRQSRERTLENSVAFRRLRDSARSIQYQSSYWHGKVVYYYLASMKWNVRRGRISTAASRLRYAILALILVGKRLISPAFWKGLTRPHYSRFSSALRDTGADALYLETNRRTEMRDTL